MSPPYHYQAEVRSYWSRREAASHRSVNDRHWAAGGRISTARGATAARVSHLSVCYLTSEKMPRKQMRNFGLQINETLSANRFGPFEVVEQVSANSFRLDLGAAASSKTIDVFHVKYLRPAVEGPYKSTCRSAFEPVQDRSTAPETGWERILDEQTAHGKSELLVQYEGQTLQNAKWFPRAELMEKAPELVAEFDNRRQQRPPQKRGKR